VSDDWDEGHGFGSSDGTYMLKDLSIQLLVTSLIVFIKKVDIKQYSIQLYQ